VYYILKQFAEQAKKDAQYRDQQQTHAKKHSRHGDDAEDSVHVLFTQSI
jgi:hypothetical protein